MRRPDQQGLELLAPPRVAAHRERAERVAVIGLAPADDVRALWLAFLDEVLARELERGLDRLEPPETKYKPCRKNWARAR